MEAENACRAFSACFIYQCGDAQAGDHPLFVSACIFLCSAPARGEQTMGGLGLGRRRERVQCLGTVARHCYWCRSASLA